MNILSLYSNFNKYFSQINFKFSLPQRKHLSTFAEGLLSSDGKKTLSDICKSTMFPKDRVFKNKLELALDTLEDPKLQREKESYVLVDSWYTSEKFINGSQKLGFQVIGAIKSNRIFYPDGIKNKLNEFSNKLNKI
ncbi:MAG: hypothetical protein B6227_05135 [Fusobacteriia bacterium 4572_74]|nr:MAG: hypothetical protein B6227_05135 [Fusobacteriia bacterium 4572_74]